MHDAAIIGAGPVGLLLAGLLAQRGLDVVVLEQRGGSAHLVSTGAGSTVRRRPHGAPLAADGDAVRAARAAATGTRSRAIGIHPPALAVLGRLGIADAAIAEGTRIDSGEVWCDGRRLGGMAFGEAEASEGFVLSLPQVTTERLLRERLMALAPDAVLNGVRFAGLVQREDHVELRIIGGSEHVLRARIVIGADGARSDVRAAAGIAWNPSGPLVHYVMADFPDDTGFGASAMLFFERGGVVESFPLPGGSRRWVAMTDQPWSQASTADLAALIGERTGQSVAGGADPRGADPVSAFSVRQHLAGSFASGRVALLGDAAHEISPIGGQGMNLGWLDARALDEALHSISAGGPAVVREALADYAKQRRARARIALTQAAFNMGMGMPAAGAKLAARNSLVRALALPPARDVMARAFTMRWL